MKNIWMLAAADKAASNEGEVISMEESAQNEAVTTTDGSNGGPAEGDGTPPPQKPNYMFLVMMAVLGLYMFFMMFRGPKKKQQEHQKMVSSLSKNDRVRTIGGIFGTVLDVRDDEIVLKIDESNNTKIKVSPQAIATVLSDKTE
ncbi:MAG: preprotein translocase subunit YajC [Planctomycetota bacterium]|jgi:preprotein translocase subunit YajC